MKVRNRLGSCARCGGRGRRRAGIAPQRGESFFICQPHVSQYIMDGLDGALQGEPDADFLKREIGVFLQQKAHVAAMAVENDRLATAAVMTGCNVTGVAALLEEFFDHGERYLKPVGDLFAGGISTVVGFEDALPKIHRNRGHAWSIATKLGTAMFLFKML